MKKYSVSIMAVVLTLFLCAFTMKKQTMSFYWFVLRGNGDFVYDRFDATPSVMCDGLLYVCSKGFALEPMQSDGHGGYICPNGVADVELFYGY